jgi:DNA mismatch endonuclease (patch repair protein)
VTAIMQENVFRIICMERYLRLKLRGGCFGKVPLKRSLAMGKIRGKNNRTTEVRLRYALVRAGIAGWRLHAAIPGRPDFYFARNKIAIFVDGCFWHGCPKCGHIPRTNRAFWRAKIERNQQRSAKWDRLLREERILVLHIWECEIKSSLHAFLSRLSHHLKRRGRRSSQVK